MAKCVKNRIFNKLESSSIIIKLTLYPRTHFLFMCKTFFSAIISHEQPQGPFTKYRRTSGKYIRITSLFCNTKKEIEYFADSPLRRDSFFRSLHSKLIESILFYFIIFHKPKLERFHRMKILSLWIFLIFRLISNVSRTPAIYPSPSLLLVTRIFFAQLPFYAPYLSFSLIIPVQIKNKDSKKRDSFPFQNFFFD